MNILPLTLTRQWFDEIASGRKTEEYRMRTEYWTKRLEPAFQGRVQITEVHFRNGYRLTSPFMRVECKGIVKKHHDYYGPVFAIQLGAVLEVRR